MKATNNTSVDADLMAAMDEISRLKEENSRLSKRSESREIEIAEVVVKKRELESDLVKAKEALNKIKKLSKYDSLYNFQTIGKIANEYFESSPTVKPEQTEEPKVTCYEIWRPNIPDNGCKTQCKECAEKENENLKVGEVEQPTDDTPEWIKEANKTGKEWRDLGLDKR